MIPIASFALLDGTYWHDITPHYMVVMGFCFIIGGCFGSFANAAAMRLVRDESPIAPPHVAVFVISSWVGEKICLYWAGYFSWSLRMPEIRIAKTLCQR